MIIEIRKAGFVNKGAHLMVLAILAKLKERYPYAKYTMVANGSSQSFEEISSVPGRIVTFSTKTALLAH